MVLNWISTASAILRTAPYVRRFVMVKEYYDNDFNNTVTFIYNFYFVFIAIKCNFSIQEQQPWWSYQSNVVVKMWPENTTRLWDNMMEKFLSWLPSSPRLIIVTGTTQHWCHVRASVVQGKDLQERKRNWA